MADRRTADGFPGIRRDDIFRLLLAQKLDTTSTGAFQQETAEDDDDGSKGERTGRSQWCQAGPVPDAGAHLIGTSLRLDGEGLIRQEHGVGIKRNICTAV